MCNENPVIGHGHPLGSGKGIPIPYLPGVQHAAAAMHHHSILLQLLREIRTASKVKFQLPSAVLFQPCRQLHRTDISALPMMGTALGY